MGGVFVFDGNNKTTVLGRGAEPLLCQPYGVHTYYVIYSQVKRPITQELQPDVS